MRVSPDWPLRYDRSLETLRQEGRRDGDETPGLSRELRRGRRGGRDSASAAPRPPDKVPVLGLIFPPANRGVPEEGVAMYGERLRFVVTGLGVEQMTPEGFESVIPRIPAAAEKLAAAGAEAIELTGTSLTFYKGEAFNQKLREAVTKASGLPATTMSNGVIDGLKAVGAKRVAVATAYNDEVNERLHAFLIEHGLEPRRRHGDRDRSDRRRRQSDAERSHRVRRARARVGSRSGFVARLLRRIQDARAHRAARSAHRRSRHLEHAARLVGRRAARRA